MGIFYEQTKVRNLSPVTLSVRFDGQDINVPPGLQSIPSVTVPYAMNQHPVMGSADPDNPHVSGAQYLIVPVNTPYDRDPLTDAEWNAHLNRPCRMDVEALMSEKLGKGEHLEVRGKGRAVQAKSSFDTGVRVSSTPMTDRME